MRIIYKIDNKAEKKKKKLEDNKLLYQLPGFLFTFYLQSILQTETEVQNVTKRKIKIQNLKVTGREITS